MIGLVGRVLGALMADAPPARSRRGVAHAGRGNCRGGAVNALMISRLNFPPLIVTLGTFSLFRGIAEGLTRGIENYSGFPQRFCSWARDMLADLVPTQLFILIVAVAGIGLVAAPDDLRAEPLRDRLFS